MEKLYKHKLNFNLALEYVRSRLDNVNVISMELINQLDFFKGYFFTLLPSIANQKLLYNFKGGGILPQNPLEEYHVSGIKSTYSIIPSIVEELALLISKEVKQRKNIVCMFDDVNCSLKHVTGYDLYENYGLLYKDEIYYLLNNTNISVDLTKECLNNSNAFWHSLCVFAEIENSEKNLSLEHVKEICMTTQLIMIGAYDGEGYVFWEQNAIDSNQEFFATSQIKGQD